MSQSSKSSRPEAAVPVTALCSLCCWRGVISLGPGSSLVLANRICKRSWGVLPVVQTPPRDRLCTSSFNQPVTSASVPSPAGAGSSVWFLEPNQTGVHLPDAWQANEKNPHRAFAVKKGRLFTGGAPSGGQGADAQSPEPHPTPTPTPRGCQGRVFKGKI